MAPSDYGNLYWCVKVPKNIAPDGEIYLYADRVEVINGDLIFWGRSGEPSELKNLALAKGSWLVFYAASVIDGAAIAVEHWTGEVNRA